MATATATRKTAASPLPLPPGRTGRPPSPGRRPRHRVQAPRRQGVHRQGSAAEAAGGRPGQARPPPRRRPLPRTASTSRPRPSGTGSSRRSRPDRPSRRSRRGGRAGRAPLAVPRLEGRREEADSRKAEPSASEVGSSPGRDLSGGSGPVVLTYQGKASARPARAVETPRLVR